MRTGKVDLLDRQVLDWLSTVKTPPRTGLLLRLPGQASPANTRRMQQVERWVGGTPRQLQASPWKLGLCPLLQDAEGPVSLDRWLGTPGQAWRGPEVGEPEAEGAVSVEAVEAAATER